MGSIHGILTDRIAFVLGHQTASRLSLFLISNDVAVPILEIMADELMRPYGREPPAFRKHAKGSYPQATRLSILRGHSHLFYA